MILRFYECIVAWDLFEHMIEEGCVIAIITLKPSSKKTNIQHWYVAMVVFLPSPHPDFFFQESSECKLLKY